VIAKQLDVGLAIERLHV